MDWWRAMRRHDATFLRILALSFLTTFVLLMIITQFGTFYSRIRLSDYETGKVAEKTLTLDRDLQFVDEEATRLKRDARERLVMPVFRINEDITRRAVDRFSQFAEVYRASWSEGVPAETLFVRIQAALPGILDRRDVAALMQADDPAWLLSTGRSVLLEALARGVIEDPLANLGAYAGESIEIVRNVALSQENAEVPLNRILTPDNLDGFVADQVSGTVNQMDSVQVLLNAFAEENAFFDEELTRKRQIQARAEVEPVVRRILKGERIVKKGFLISETDMAVIRQVGIHSATVNVHRLLGTGFFLLMLYLLSVMLLSEPLAGKRLKTSYTYLLMGMWLIWVLLMAVLMKVTRLPEWFPFSVILPTAMMAMTVTVLLTPQAGISISLVFSLALFLVTQMDPFAFLFAFLSGTASSLIVTNTRQRIDLIRAGAFVGGINAMILMILGFFRSYELAWFVLAAWWGFLNGFLCGILALGFMPLLEHLLNAPTQFRLMELSDLNSPVLKKMLTLAPGTYSHSIQVAHLAESACREIGADALLARVGAYYHDIGKLDQPEYFIENQATLNKHDELKPSLSVAVIKSHVKIGVEKAKEIFLPTEVIDIIAQHHGKGLISYFYQRALVSEGAERISQEDFCYNGTPPTSKEAAVVMLADSVEAAGRTLKKPTVAKLEKFVWSIIMEKFDSGQLNDSDLTFRELDSIKRTFVQILAGHYHTRIEYPKTRELAR